VSSRFGGPPCLHTLVCFEVSHSVVGVVGHQMFKLAGVSSCSSSRDTEIAVAQVQWLGSSKAHLSVPALRPSRAEGRRGGVALTRRRSARATRQRKSARARRQCSPHTVGNDKNKTTKQNRNNKKLFRDNKQVILWHIALKNGRVGGLVLTLKRGVGFGRSPV
jgi:hypothetical protein